MVQNRTVRELSGEIAAEITHMILDGVKPFTAFEDDEKTKLFDACIDLISGVLARYDGFLIVNDEGFPVEPLPRTRFDTEESTELT